MPITPTRNSGAVRTLHRAGTATSNNALLQPPPLWIYSIQQLCLALAQSLGRRRSERIRPGTHHQAQIGKSNGAYVPGQIHLCFAWLEARPSDKIF